MISYWREHRRRRWCLHLRDRALALLTSGDSPPVHVARSAPSTRRSPTLSDFAVTGRQRLSITGAAGLRLSLAASDLVTFIGSGPECRWRFLDAGLDRRHYVLFALDGAMYGIDLHHVRCHPDAAVGEWWQPRTIVRIGTLTLRPQSVAFSEPEKRADAASALSLQMHWNAAGQLHSQAMQSRITLFGSSRWNAVRLHDPGVAPVQAALVRLPRSLVLINLVDNTWTRRRGEPVQWSLLDPGDEFEVGRATFQLSANWDDPAAPAPQPLLTQLH